MKHFSWAKNVELDPGIEEGKEQAWLVVTLHGKEKKVMWAGPLEILFIPKPKQQSCWTCLGWFYQRSLALHTLFPGTSNEVYTTIWMASLRGNQKTPDNFNKSSLPSLSPIKLGICLSRPSLLGVHDGMAPVARSKCTQPVANPSALVNLRCTAPLSSCCAIVLAVSVGAIRCMACNCFEIAQGCLP